MCSRAVFVDLPENRGPVFCLLPNPPKKSSRSIFYWVGKRQLSLGPSSHRYQPNHTVVKGSLRARGELCGKLRRRTGQRERRGDRQCEHIQPTVALTVARGSRRLPGEGCSTSLLAQYSSRSATRDAAFRRQKPIRSQIVIVRAGRCRRAVTMCEKCVELDEKIEHYGELSRWISDQKTIEQFKLFIEKLRAKKAALHPGAK
jgi:hypothetical protein